MNIRELYRRFSFYEPSIEGFVMGSPVKGSDLTKWAKDTRENFTEEEWPEGEIIDQVEKYAHQLAEYHNLGLTLIR